MQAGAKSVDAAAPVCQRFYIDWRARLRNTTGGTDAQGFLLMPRGSTVSGWQYLPLKANQRAQRDVLLRMILRAARALAEHQLVRCTDFAFEQRAVVRTPTGRPGTYHYDESKTLDPNEAWFDAHEDGAYRLELCVLVNQPERGGVPGVIASAMEAVVGAQLEAAEEQVQRRRRKRSVLRREDLARIFASFRRDEVVEARA